MWPNLISSDTFFVVLWRFCHVNSNENPNYCSPMHWNALYCTTLFTTFALYFYSALFRAKFSAVQCSAVNRFGVDKISQKQLKKCRVEPHRASKVFKKEANGRVNSCPEETHIKTMAVNKKSCICIKVTPQQLVELFVSH